MQVIASYPKDATTRRNRKIVGIVWKRRVRCSVCSNLTQRETAHRHRGAWVGDECCWDERLRTTE